MTVLVGNSTVNSSIDISFARIGANSTFTMLTANATGIYANSTLVANSIGPYGKTEGSLNVNNATTATSAPNPNAITFNNGGAGAASGSTYTGSATLTVSYNTVGAPSTSGTGASGTWSININGSAASATNASAATNATFATSAGTANTTQALTFASDGTGAAATTTFNGGTARTISYNSVGAPSITGTNASGTWSININGSAASATNASAATNATTATNQSGGTVSATTGSFSSDLSFNSGYGSAAVAYGCRVWIRFVVSAGVPAISNDGNVSTITDNGVGNFVINFTTALVDANYAAVANYSETNSATGGGNDGQASCHTYATGSVRIYCARGDGSANDPARCSLIVCR